MVVYKVVRGATEENMFSALSRYPATYRLHQKTLPPIPKSKLLAFFDYDDARDWAHDVLLNCLRYENVSAHQKGSLNTQIFILKCKTDEAVPTQRILSFSKTNYQAFWESTEKMNFPNSHTPPKGSLSCDGLTPVEILKTVPIF